MAGAAAGDGRGVRERGINSDRLADPGRPRRQGMPGHERFMPRKPLQGAGDRPGLKRQRRPGGRQRPSANAEQHRRKIRPCAHSTRGRQRTSDPLHFMQPGLQRAAPGERVGAVARALGPPKRATAPCPEAQASALGRRPLGSPSDHHELCHGGGRCDRRARAHHTFGGLLRHGGRAHSGAMEHHTAPLEALLASELQHAAEETRAQLQGLEVADSDFGEWIKAGGSDRRQRPRLQDSFEPGHPKYL